MSKQTQYKALKALGLSDPAASVVMGHADTESGCETNRLQGDFEATRAWSRSYTSMVDSGEISRDDFIFRGPGGGGYGWLQWTEKSRKRGYYDYAKAQGVSIGSEEAAIGWFWEELHQPQFSGVLRALETETDIRAMSDVFLRRFEMPADQSESAAAARAARCQAMLDRFGGSASKPLVKDPVSATFPPDPSVKQIQYVMWDNDYWPIDQINGYKSAEFFLKLREFVDDMESC